MTRLFLVIVCLTSVLLTVSAVNAAPYVERVKLSAVEAADGTWASLAQRAGLIAKGKNPWADGGEVADLPKVVVGQMFGGVWGADDGKTVRVHARKWQLFTLQEKVPGVRVDLDEGIFLHAEKGANGTHFIFAGITGGGSASDLASQLNRYLDPRGSYWDKFEAAVGNTVTGKNAAKAYDALVDMGVTWDEKGVPTVPDKLKGAPATKPGAPAERRSPRVGPGGPAADGGKGDENVPATGNGGPNNKPFPWWLVAVIAVLAAITGVVEYKSTKPEPVVAMIFLTGLMAAVCARALSVVLSWAMLWWGIGGIIVAFIAAEIAGEIYKRRHPTTT